MTTTLNGAHPLPPLCRACAFDFHDQCAGCHCRCDQATAARLTAAALAEYGGAEQAQPTVSPPVSFTDGERAELARLAGLPGVTRLNPEPADDPPPAAGHLPIGGRVLPRLFGLFYVTVALAALAGQVSAAVVWLGWPVLAVLPVVAVVELGGVVMAARADERRRLNEHAWAARVTSAAVAAGATVLNFVGHHAAGEAIAGYVFAGLTLLGYFVWLIDSGYHRRDALRAAGKLAETAPDYGLYRRLRHPILAARAAELAREHGYDLYASLRAAELAIRAEKRRPAIAAAVGELVRAEHRDPRMATIAVTTLDLDRIAVELTDRAEYGQWADRLAPAVMAHRPDPTPGTAPGTVPPKATRNGSGSGRRKRRGAVPPEPGSPNMADRIRQLAAKQPELSRAELARRLDVTDRYVRNVLNGPARNDNP
jgi:hypothetical protein